MPHNTIYQLVTKLDGNIERTEPFTTSVNQTKLTFVGGELSTNVGLDVTRSLIKPMVLVHLTTAIYFFL